MIYIPVSAGELLDKVSILEIKQTRIVDAAKLEHIERELYLLRKAATGMGLYRFHDERAAELKRINETIWDAEEGLRACEAGGDFGERFIALARTVYRENDRRAAVKREINTITDFDLVEEKSY